MGTDRLADEVIRDPFEKAQSIDIGGSSAEERLLQNVIKNLIPPGIDIVGKIPLLATPSDEPKHVIDAKEAGECIACHSQVWLSPSSLRVMKEENCLIICLRCVLNEAKKLKGGASGV